MSHSSNSVSNEKVLEVVLRLEERIDTLEERLINRAKQEKWSCRCEENSFRSERYGPILGNENSSIEMHNEKLHENLDRIYELLLNQVNERTLSLEWLATNTKLEVDHIHKIVSQLVCRLNAAEEGVVETLAGQPQYTFHATKDIATESSDIIEPESTFEGIVSRPNFVLACERILNKQHLKFLDIGCGSGAVTFDFLRRGHFSAGIDGSDACSVSNIGYWNYLDNLHTCDVTKEFEFISEDFSRLRFDIISMWEVFEHIPEELCSQLLRNVYNNLSDEGLFVGSISRLEYTNENSGRIYHVTLKPRSWWEKKFEDNGFVLVASEFSHDEYCRGVGGRYQDPHDYRKNPEKGFHFTAKKSKRIRKK